MARARSVGKRAPVARATGRRDEIMRTAGVVMRERKASTLRMQQVAERLGLVKGNLYYYFKDRQDLIYHCHVRCVEMSLQALEEIENQEIGPREKLRRLLQRHIHASLGTDYGGVLRTDMDEMKPAQRKRYVALRDRFEAAVRRLIDEGVVEGEFRCKSSRLAGFAILGSINFMHKWYHPGGEKTLSELADWFADFYLRALRA